MQLIIISLFAYLALIFLISFTGQMIKDIIRVVYEERASYAKIIDDITATRRHQKQ